jgi:aryl-alcohol dehydrogenase-like predicted oxidoreductase
LGIIRWRQNTSIDLDTHIADVLGTIDTPIEETLAAYAELITAGKVRAIGAAFGPMSDKPIKKRPTLLS